MQYAQKGECKFLILIILVGEVSYAMGKKKCTSEEMHFLRSGRGERIRTSGLYVPNVALYQAKLHPDCSGVPSYP